MHGASLLAIVWEPSDEVVTTPRSAVLVRLSARSLEPASSRRLVLGHEVGAWSLSPDGSQLAIAVASPNVVKLVGVDRLELLGMLQLGLSGYVTEVTWPSRDRILVLLEDGPRRHSLVSIDPVAQRVVARRLIRGTRTASANTHDGLAVLLGPETPRIGASRLTVIDADGDTRSIGVPRVLSGIVGAEHSANGMAAAQLPGLAVDESGERAFVVGPDLLVAEVDLRSLRVTYHEVDANESLVRRLLDWLEPAAEAKTTFGAVRYARWIGDRWIAVSGWDEQPSTEGEGVETPAGLRLIDTRDWSVRTLDRKASAFSFAAGVLIAYGAHTASGGTTPLGAPGEDRVRGMGVSGYGLDGRRRFHFLGDKAVVRVETAGDHAYAAVSDSTGVSVIDLGSGRLLGTLGTDEEPGLPTVVAEALP